MKFVCVMCACAVLGYICVRVQGAPLATREGELGKQSDNEVFKIPRMLEGGDTITVTGLTTDVANRKTNQSNNEDAYGIRLNGDTQRAPQAPRWPASQYPNEKMFLLPKKLDYGDTIHISGQTTPNRQSLTISLLTEQGGYPDYQNAACQIEVRFNPEEDSVSLRTVENGKPEEPADFRPDKASDLFGDTVFDFKFSLRYGNYTGVGSMEVDVGPSMLGKVDLKHDIHSIRFLTVNGDVDKISKLDFEFA